MSHRSEAVQLLTALLLGLLLLLSLALLQTRRGAEQVGNLRVLLRCQPLEGTAAPAAANASDAGQQHSASSSTLVEHRPQRPHCNRLEPGDQLSGGGGNITFNPAGIFNPEFGWLVVARHEPETYHMTWPLVWQLGKDPKAVDLSLVNDTGAIWQLDDDTLGAAAAARRNHTFIKAEDYRPFLWNGSLWTSFSLWSGDWHVNPIVICMSRMDMAQRMITAARCFDKLPLHKNGFIREKNWAFKELDGELLVLHQLAPVTTFLRVVPGAPKGLELLSATAFEKDPRRGQVLTHTGLLFDDEVHISGHPVDLPTSLMGDAAADGGHREWFVMAHRRNSDTNYYQHWGFRISLKTLELTHVSKGPILSPSSMDGDTENRLVVGSYHFTEQHRTNSLVVFFGLADTRACVTNVLMDSVAWYHMPEGRKLSLNESGYQLS